MVVSKNTDILQSTPGELLLQLLNILVLKDGVGERGSSWRQSTLIALLKSKKIIGVYGRLQGHLWLRELTGSTGALKSSFENAAETATQGEGLRLDWESALLREAGQPSSPHPVSGLRVFREFQTPHVCTSIQFATFCTKNSKSKKQKVKNFLKKLSNLSQKGRDWKQAVGRRSGVTRRKRWLMGRADLHKQW